MSIVLSDLLAEFSTALSAIPEFAAAGKRKIGPWVSRVTPPSVIIDPASEGDYDTTYAPGMDLYPIEVTVVGAMTGSASWGALGPYMSKAGPQSVPAALNGHDWVSCSDVYVRTWEFVVVTFSGNDYLGVTFKVDTGG